MACEHKGLSNGHESGQYSCLHTQDHFVSCDDDVELECVSIRDDLPIGVTVVELILVDQSTAVGTVCVCVVCVRVHVCACVCIFMEGLQLAGHNG